MQSFAESSSFNVLWGDLSLVVFLNDQAFICCFLKDKLYLDVQKDNLSCVDGVLFQEQA